MTERKGASWARAVAMTGILSALAALVAAEAGTAQVTDRAANRARTQVTHREQVRNAFPEEAWRRLEAVVDAARDHGLPVGPLYDKALEGVAKRVPPARVVPAVEAYAGRLRSARMALGAGAEPGVLVAGADALHRGVTLETMRALEPESRGSPLALVVLGDLVESGVAAEQAVEVVREAMARHGVGSGMLQVSEAVRGLMRGGHAPGAAAATVMRALREGRALHRLPGGMGPGGGRMGAPAPPGSQPVHGGRGG